MTPTELTLDPASWDDFRILGHRMLDDMVDYLASVRERPVWQPFPDAVRTRLAEPLPHQGKPAEAVYEQFKRDVLPYPPGNIHPRFWGWVIGTGTPLAMLADMLASGMNPQAAGVQEGARHVEERVIAWLAEVMGFPAGSSGLLVSGGSMANLVALAVARQAKAGFDVREQGVGNGAPALVVYTSTEGHSSVKKAVELMGLGHRNLRLIPVDAAFRIDIAALKAAIAADRAQGRRPICVVGSAGTVNTGATDDLAALGALCRAENLWFHVDGAFGALVRLAPELAGIVRGLETADSVAFDLHKWGYLPFEVGCTLIRHPEVHHDTFAAAPSYLGATARGLAAGGVLFADLGIQLSRGFRALKVWMAFKTHGIDAIGKVIAQNVAQIRYLVSLIEAHPQLELLAPAPLNICCFRYVAPGLEATALNALNQEILWRLQESGVALPSHTVLDGRFAIRVANTNQRSRSEDFDLLVKTVVEIGDAVRQERTVEVGGR
ncbi:MAG TPA: pyridoxal-dependent decarboxylase [Gemmatimonadales bacterium]|nr:pyridoxal-dependent decarboxylase [Gemmatimonadales bacterium]